jgi:hypothetical protein
VVAGIALLCGVGYIIAIAAVLAVAGGFLSITLQQYLHWNIPWGIFTVLLTLGAVLMMIRGVPYPPSWPGSSSASRCSCSWWCRSPPWSRTTAA